ncbi:MAG TPA: SRPBCC family protein, partial [Verrucomicrobiae bacterium]|nr:SRPBCC family protein [Verrucomicrobiae bacterium]
AAWDAIRDVGAAHVRLFPGVLSGVTLEGEVRIVTFANGLVVREPIVSIDDAAKRFAWAAVGGRATHYNASLQVTANAGGGSRIVWIADFLPNEIADSIDGLMQAGSAAMKAALERAIPSTSS